MGYAHLTYTYSVGKAAKSIMGGVSPENEDQVREVTIVSTTSDSTQDFEDTYGPRIHGLQLGMDRNKVQSLLENFIGKHHLKREIYESREELLSTLGDACMVRIDFGEDNKVVAYSFSPKFFNVRDFLSPRFLHEFKQFYNLQDLASDVDEPDILREINDSANYSLSIYKDKIVVEQQYDDNPFFA